LAPLLSGVTLNLQVGTQAVYTAKQRLLLRNNNSDDNSVCVRVCV